MSDRNIGKVISVDSFRVFIRLDDDLKSLYKSGYEDIYEVARINSYVIIPIGADRIVAMVTSVRAIDETELGKNKEAIFLTKSSRFLIATMIGTIENDGRYIQGVYNYPILDNPVWYVVREDLDAIFDQQPKDNIDFSEDYYLPIGTSPSFTDYKIKINPDKFFGKHSAILGNTGSGKSCTFASIIQSLFSFKYNGQLLQSAHFVVFDTNGEYKQAFMGTNEVPYAKLKEVNPFHIDKDGLKVPFWFMNFSDFDYLFTPTAGTQTNNFVIKNMIYSELEDFIDEFSSLETDFDKNNIISSLQRLLEEKSKLSKNGNYLNGCVSSQVLSEFSENIEKELSTYNQTIRSQETAEERNIDLPIYFNFEELINRYFEEAIIEQENSGNKLREFVSTLRLRLQSYLGDERLCQPLMMDQTAEIENSLAKFIAFILGDFCKVYSQEDDDIFTLFYKDKTKADDTKKANQVTIIDMSLLPFDVLETITGLVGRLILEFVSRFPEEERGKMPIVIALEEAQNYIPERNRGDKESISKKIFERIAREGRKYGISLLISSQRPSELSKTVLSQCNSFVVHRLQNPDDQTYVRQLVSAANNDILQQLPILPQQHAIIMGDAVRTPVQARMNTANPKPNSNNPKFIENWIQNSSDDFPAYKDIAKAWEKGEKINTNNKE